MDFPKGFPFPPDVACPRCAGGGVLITNHGEEVCYLCNGSGIREDTIELTIDEQATLDRALDRMENFGITEDTE